MTRFVTPGLFLVCLLSIAPLLAAEPQTAGPALRIIRDKADHPIAVEANGLPGGELANISKQNDAHDTFTKLLAIGVVSDAANAEPTPMAGTYSVVESSLRFTPRFPLIAGTRYRAVLRPAAFASRADSNTAAEKGSTKQITLEINVPADQPGEPTEVVQVYPSAATLPENNLRFYIHFSESMGRGEAYQHLHLLDAKGKLIEEAFLEIGEELWDPRAKRLTLLIDPGRIKKGVKPREEEGPVLEAGREYSLLIGRDWRDAAGRPLKAEFRKKFRAGPPVEAAIDPAEWKIGPPTAGSLNPLVIRFPRSLDRALLERTISVSGLEGPSVAGRVAVSDDERRWEFRPHAPWQAGRFQLVIDTALEDLAGNRIGKPFEIDEFSEVDKSAETEPTRLPFEVHKRT
ncbi:MAG TPA: Ig-like domain-containing protein, partial [Planctomycetaceae bacterium]|jgi:hypothetical protein